MACNTADAEVNALTLRATYGCSSSYTHNRNARFHARARAALLDDMTCIELP